VMTGDLASEDRSEVEATAQCRAACVSASIGMDRKSQPAVGGLNVFRGRCRSEVEKLEYPLLSDPDGAVATAFGVRRWFLSPVKRHVRHQCRRRDRQGHRERIRHDRACPRGTGVLAESRRAGHLTCRTGLGRAGDGLVTVS